MRFQPRSFITLASLATLAWLLPGCDNPACVFGGDCFGTGGGTLGDGVVSLPSNGDWVEAAVPDLVRFAPSGSAGVNSTSPLVLFFNETLSNSGLSNAFELQSDLVGNLPATAVSFGDGRCVLVVPVTALQPETSYSLRYREGAQLSDRTGQRLNLPADLEITTFTVNAEDTAVPRVVATYPEDGDINQSASGEVVVIFDRPIDASTMNNQAFAVTVGGLEPADNPDPTALALAGGLQTDRRVWRWRSSESLGQDQLVAVELSAVGSELLDDDGGEVEPTQFDFRTAPFAAPTRAAITSIPSDAIGIDALSGPANLAVEVEFIGAQAGDRVGVYVFGNEPNVAEPELIAIGREVALEAPYTSITLTAAELDLTSSLSPLQPRFAEGNLSFAVQLRRGSVSSPITRLDVDELTSGIQDPLLDVTAPQLVGFGLSGANTSLLLSSLRDLVVVARANESISAAAVSSLLGDNFGGNPDAPEVAGSHSSGLFVAQPVPLGVLDPRAGLLDFELTIYDRARNATGPIPAQFAQRGLVGPGLATGADLSVRVFDAVSLAPIVGAQVHTHEDLAGLLIGVAVGSTDSAGSVLIKAGLLSPTILTVVAPGYELTTFDGVTSDRLDVLLEPQAQTGGNVSGKVKSTNPEILLYTGQISDSRAAGTDALLRSVNACGFQPQTTSYECPYSAFAIRARELGAQVSLASLPVPNVLLFTPENFLKAADLVFPLPSVNPGVTQLVDHSYSALLDDADLPPEELPLEYPPQLLSTLGFPSLDGDLAVSVEARLPGVLGTLAVGAGQAFAAGIPDSFAVRAAYPGAAAGFARAPGRWTAAGSINPDLFLRVRALGSDGSVGIARPRLSDATVTLDLPLAPGPGAVPIDFDGSGGGYVLALTDSHPDSQPEVGLYRTVVEDQDGQRWVLWRTDGPDADGPEFLLRMPFVGPGGSFPLAAGDLSVQSTLYAWPELDTSEYFQAELEREYTRLARSAAWTVTPP